MSRNAIGVASALLFVAVAVPFEGSPVYTQTPALDVVPIVGHWRQHMDAGEPVATVDGTKWDKKPLADPVSIARELFRAPAGEAATRFVANASSAGAFPLAAVRGVDAFTSGTARVQFKLIAGASDQLAGLVFDLRPTGAYLAVRYNTKDGNVALWKFADGARARLADGTGHAQLPLDAWHTIELQVVDRQVTGIVNGTLRVEHALDQPVGGRVGLWAKPDSVSAFKGLRIQK
jgi:hypothetical protein